jgi:hypothetical protein
VTNASQASWLVQASGLAGRGWRTGTRQSKPTSRRRPAAARGLGDKNTTFLSVQKLLPGGTVGGGGSMAVAQQRPNRRDADHQTTKTRIKDMPASTDVCMRQTCTGSHRRLIYIQNHNPDPSGPSTQTQTKGYPQKQPLSSLSHKCTNISSRPKLLFPTLVVYSRLNGSLNFYDASTHKRTSLPTPTLCPAARNRPCLKSQRANGKQSV